MAAKIKSRPRSKGIGKSGKESGKDRSKEIYGGRFNIEPNSEPLISIDGIALSEFDYIDIGALIPSSGAVPVVIKSLIFRASQPQ